MGQQMVTFLDEETNTVVTRMKEITDGSDLPVVDSRPQYVYDRIEGKYDTPDADGNPVLLHAGYPSLEDQLDMIFHAIEAGTLDTTSEFFTTLKAVKDANPKA